MMKEHLFFSILDCSRRSPLVVHIDNDWHFSLCSFETAYVPITVKVYQRKAKQRAAYLFVHKYTSAIYVFVRVSVQVVISLSSERKMPVQRGLAFECREHFQTSDLYEIFSISRTATDAQGTVSALVQMPIDLISSISFQ